MLFLWSDFILDKIDQLDPAFHVRLDINPVCMILYGLKADKQFFGDLLVAKSIAYLTYNVRFPGRYLIPSAEFVERHRNRGLF